jgi:hypothetical protein
MIILGLARGTLTFIRDVGTRAHPNSGNTRQWGMFRIRTWFSFFFIPVIPYGTEHVVMCPVCSRGFHTTKNVGADVTAAELQRNHATTQQPRKLLDRIGLGREDDDELARRANRQMKEDDASE